MQLKQLLNLSKDFESKASPEVIFQRFGNELFLFVPSKEVGGYIDNFEDILQKIKGAESLDYDDILKKKTAHLSAKPHLFKMSLDEFESLEKERSAFSNRTRDILLERTLSLPISLRLRDFLHSEEVRSFEELKQRHKPASQRLEQLELISMGFDAGSFFGGVGEKAKGLYESAREFFSGKKEEEPSKEEPKQTEPKPKKEDKPTTSVSGSDEIYYQLASGFKRIQSESKRAASEYPPPAQLQSFLRGYERTGSVPSELVSEASSLLNKSYWSAKSVLHNGVWYICLVEWHFDDHTSPGNKHWHKGVSVLRPIDGVGSDRGEFEGPGERELEDSKTSGEVAADIPIENRKILMKALVSTQEPLVSVRDATSTIAKWLRPTDIGGAVSSAKDSQLMDIFSDEGKFVPSSYADDDIIIPGNIAFWKGLDKTNVSGIIQSLDGSKITVITSNTDPKVSDKKTTRQEIPFSSIIGFGVVSSVEE